MKVFGIALLIIILVVGIFLVPTVKAILDDTIAAESAGWNSEVQAAVSMFFIAFIVLVVVCAIMAVKKE